MSKSLVHLHVHNEYSWDAVGTAPIFAERAVEIGSPALGSTNHGVLGGSIAHVNACAAAGLLPILGVEGYYRPDRLVQGQKDIRFGYMHMTVLAANYTGWLNLMRLNSEAHMSGFYQMPCFDLSLLRKHREGLIFGLGCIRGQLCQHIKNGDSVAARGWVRQLKDLVGDRLFGEIMPANLPEQISSNLEIIRVCDEESVMVAATVDAHAPDESWVAAQRVRLDIAVNQTIKEKAKKAKEGADVFELSDPSYFIQSRQQVLTNFAANHPGISAARAEEACDNTFNVAAMVEPILFDRTEKLPKIDRGRPDIDILRERADAGMVDLANFWSNRSTMRARELRRNAELLEERGQTVEAIEAIDEAAALESQTSVYDDAQRWNTTLQPEYDARLRSELEQIDRSGFASYFLQVADEVEWAQSDRGQPDKNGREKSGEKKPIEVGPGRGSAAGSLVSDRIGITNIDPIAYRLRFERFLNIDRRGLPDIDIDWPANRIDEVEEHTKRKNGKANVYDVIAHITFGPRAAIRRVGTAMCLPPGLINDSCKQIDDTDRSALEDLRATNAALDTIADDHPEAFDIMCKLQGQIAGRSEHAAALMVTSPETPIIDIVPLERLGGMKGKIVTSYGERAGKGNQIISDYGLMKFDWLRVVELDKQVYALDLIHERRRRGLQMLVLNQRDHTARIDQLRGDDEVSIKLGDLTVHRDPYAVDKQVMRDIGDGYLSGIFHLSAVASKLCKRIKPANMFEIAAINGLKLPAARNVGDDERYVRRKRGEEAVTLWHPDLEPYLGYTHGVIVFQEQLMDVVQHLGGLTGGEADTFRKIASKLYRTPDYAREVMGAWYDQIRDGFIQRGVDVELFERKDGYWDELLSRCSYSFNLSHASGYGLLSYRDAWLKTWYPEEFFAAHLSVGLSNVKDLHERQKEAAVREAKAPRFGIKVLPPDINESCADYSISDGKLLMGISSVKNVGPAGVKEILANQPFDSLEDFDARVAPQKCNIIAKGNLINGGVFDRWHRRDHLTEEKIDELEREILGISLTSAYSINAYSDVIDSRIKSEGDVDSVDDGTVVTVAGDVIGVKKIHDKNKREMAFVDLGYGGDTYSISLFADMWEWYESIVGSHRPLIVRGEKQTYKGRISIIPLKPEMVCDEYGQPVIRPDGHHEWRHFLQDVDALAKVVRAQPAAA